MTSNLQIERFFRTHAPPQLRRLFGGVYSKDELVGRNPNGRCYVVNLQDSDEGDGTHWVAVADFLDIPVYIDPYGITPPPVVREFMGRSRSRLPGVYSRAQYQSLSSDQCGEYCVLFLLELWKFRHDTLTALRRLGEGMTEEPSVGNERLARQVRLRR